MLNWCYYLFILKHIELLETLFFILRKKNKQVSKLHVYHHGSTCLLAWIGVKYAAGGMATFGPMLNCIVHVFMYTYYFLTSLGVQWRAAMQEWKPKLTLLQITQLFIIMIHASSSLWHPECKKERYLAFIYLSDIILMFYMFVKFYRENYCVDRKTK